MEQTGAMAGAARRPVTAVPRARRDQARRDQARRDQARRDQARRDQARRSGPAGRTA